MSAPRGLVSGIVIALAGAVVMFASYAVAGAAGRGAMYVASGVLVWGVFLILRAVAASRPPQ